MAVAALIALLVWPLLALGGASDSVAVPFSIACILFALVLVPRFSGRLDPALAVLVAAVFAQLMPLPETVVNVLSPSAIAVRDALALRARAPSPLPLTIDSQATALAALELVGVVALFVAAREMFRDGGIRRVSAAVASMGLGVTLLAMVQAATAGRSVYWLFGTDPAAPLPFGPFRDRNDFATWTIMATPLCAGYLAARSGAHQPPGRTGRRRALLSLGDMRTFWLTAAVVVLLVGLLLSLSRSAVAALTLASILTIAAYRRSARRAVRAAVLVTVALISIAAFAWRDGSALRLRIGGSPPPDLRTTIWRQSMPVVRDFWIAGTGAGTYERAMRRYQRTERGVVFNQAQNHYVQLLVEGGLLLTIPAAAALAAFALVARGRLSRDVSRARWIRAGAACGLAAALLQSAWECSMVASANAALGAVLAAIVVHERD